MKLAPHDLSICREIHAGLVSKERNSINYLFLEPVDPIYFPTYPSIVKHPMDLRTLKENIENDVYTEKEEFYADAKLIFDNAVLFNKDREESGFVVDLARSMSKAFERVRKSAEKKAARLAAGSGGGSKKASKEGEKKKEGGEKKKKINIKLKRQKSVGDVSKASSVESSSVGGEVSSTSDPKPAKKAKTKLKLKLSTGQSDAKKGDATKKKTKSTPKSSSQNSDAPQSEALKSDAPKLDHPKSDAAAVKVDVAPMNTLRQAQCVKILSSLKRRQPSACKWFHKPVTDPVIVKDYKEKISNPMDLSTISSKLDKNQYKTVCEFVQDLRLIAANCLQYNTTVDDSFRPVAVDFLTTAEDLCKFFIAKHEAPKTVYPSLLYCWADCIKAIDELINMTNPEDRLQTAWFFLHPVTYFCSGQYPEGYLEKVSKPIDLGSIVQHLTTGHYNSVGAFVADCRRVVENCNAYYAGDEEGVTLCEKANRLHGRMEKSLGQLFIFDQSDKGGKAKVKAASKYMVIKQPEKDFLRNILQELRAATYTDRSAKITEKATLHFEKPVDSEIFTDYPQYVETPMDLETVDRKIESGSYICPEDFEYDVSLIFKNCLDYNGPKKNMHMVTLGKHTAKIFRKLFAERMRGGPVAKRPSLPTLANRVAVAAPVGKTGAKKRAASPLLDERPTKRVSIKGPSRTAPKSVSIISSGKSAPSAKSVSSSGKLAVPKPGKLAKKISNSPSKIILANSSAPIPMHVAIASIKESYPGRRQNKDLEGWEAECLKFLRQLMKHPWVSAERPKYVFHVPVHILFPEIRDTYAAKIKQPMDLTTCEAKLLQGIYQDGEEFISDVALVFSNAIAFNKEGHEFGEAMSCAYYEASTHLLKYIRWLSLELLQSCLTNIDSPVVESGSASSWKLTIRNKEMARKEMELTVFNEMLDKTEPGDKYSWSEQECEKLLKALRHTSDIKHMSFFIQSTFPPDYTAYISKPIAWDRCQERLRHRKYNTIGEIVADLRLIFSNALKYNEGARHVSKISGMAYDSSIHMSRKLEAAIDKMLLAVGDRIGRERIDMITSQREMDAMERAEEDQRKRDWENENPGSTVEIKTKLRIVNQRSRSKTLTDFEFPFYDEEEEQGESHANSLQHVKGLYEKQREARANSQEIALSIGISVFRRLQERAAAKAYVDQMAYKAKMERLRIEKEQADAKKEDEAEKTPSIPKGAFVSSALKDSGRKQIKMLLQKPKRMKRKCVMLQF